MREIFARWKSRGTPIDFADLKEIAAIVAPERRLDEDVTAKIVAAAQAAGVRVGCDQFAAKPWRDSRGRERTDRLSPPGWIWSEGLGWFHVKLCVGSGLDYTYYLDANPGARQLYEESLPPRAWAEWDAMEKLREERALRRREPAVSVAQKKWDAKGPLRLDDERQRQALERAAQLERRT